MSEQKTLAEVFRAHTYDRMTCYDHEGHCCPGGCHDLTESQYDHYQSATLAHLASDRVEAMANAIWREYPSHCADRAWTDACSPCREIPLRQARAALAAQREVLGGGG